MRRHQGACHCGAIVIELRTSRAPADQVIGACQCSFCRKHNIRAFSDPGASVTMTAQNPDCLQLYGFGLRTSQSVICSVCGVYIGMILEADGRVWSTISVDALDDRAQFIKPPQVRDYSGESETERIDRRKAKWIPTDLLGWPGKKS